MIIKKGSTDQTLYFKLTTAAGAPATALTITDLDLTYIRDLSVASKADLTALAAVDSSHTDNKAIEVDATNAPGLYRVDVPDAAFATGVNRVQVVVNGAAIDPSVIECELVAYDPQDAVRMGQTALPAAIPGQNGGLPTTNGTVINQTVGLTAGSAASIITALKASTGYSVGTLTYAEIIQIIASAVAGKVIDKAGVAGTIQHLDVEDATTAIFENVPSNTTSPYRDPTIL